MYLICYRYELYLSCFVYQIASTASNFSRCNVQELFSAHPMMKFKFTNTPIRLSPTRTAHPRHFDRPLCDRSRMMNDGDKSRASRFCSWCRIARSRGAKSTTRVGETAIRVGRKASRRYHLT